MHYLPKNCNSKTDLEISVSHVMIPLGSLNKNGENVFNLQGGDPSNPVFIDPADVRTKRTGFKTLVRRRIRVDIYQCGVMICVLIVSVCLCFLGKSIIEEDRFFSNYQHLNESRKPLDS